MLKELQTRHREIARLSFQGFKPKEISEKTGMGIDRVYAILRDPMAKSFIAGLNDKADDAVLDTRKRLIKLEAKAMDRAEDILGDDSKAPPAAMVSLIKDVLDRNGYKAPEKVEVKHEFENMNNDELDEQIKNLENMIKEVNIDKISNDDIK